MSISLSEIRELLRDLDSRVDALEGGGGGGGASVPVGGLVPHAGSAVPTGYLAANGAAVSRTTYAALFTAIGTAWGAGDGSTTFNLPDLRGRFPIGAGTLGSDTYAVGGTGGEARHALTTAELAAHTHTMAHDHTYHLDRRASATAFGGSGDLGITSATGTVSDIDPATSASSAANTGSAGSGTAHENRPPYAAVTYVIRAT